MSYSSATPERYVQSGVIGMTVISTANTNRDGTGAMGTVLTGGPNGTLVSQVLFVANETTIASMLRVFVHDGSNALLMKEIGVSIVVPSITVAGFTDNWTPVVPVILPEGWSIRASTHSAKSFNVFAFGGEF